LKKHILILALCAGLFITDTPAVYAAMANKYLVTDTLKKKVKPAVNFPTLPNNVSHLFYVQRDPNTNTIVYELNIGKDGQINDEEPIHPYWIRYNENGQREELSYIQRKFAYGLSQKSLGNGKYDIRFVSYKKYPLTLMKSADGKYHIYATIAQKQAILNRIFVKIEGGSFWLPNVVYVEIKGTDPATGQEIVDRFKP
jgi:hypothetical protein